MSSLIPSGANTYSKTRYPASAPKVADFTDGPWVTCENGRRYVDAVAALGPIILGHQYPAVHKAAFVQMNKGVSVSLPTTLEHDLAERLVKLVPGAEMCRFGKNGNDVVNAAVRVARAATGRNLVIRNGYHGHADWCIEEPMAGGVLRENRISRMPISDLGSVQDGTVAAVVLDPCPAHDPTIQPPEYFYEIRRLCTEHGALLIFDEMVTGFRMGWPNSLPVVPDLWCGAKALGNGWPITALVGKREYMERIERDVFYSTTFAGEAVSIAAALACLDELARHDVPRVLAEMGTRLRDWYAKEAAGRGLQYETEIVGYPARPVFRWKRPELQDAFSDGVIRGGMLFQGYVNLMLAHREAWSEILVALSTGLDAALRVHATERMEATVP